MVQNKYTMIGKDGELLLAVNGFALVYAEKFTAVLTESLKEMSFRGQMWSMQDHCEARLVLRELSSPHPDVVDRILADVADRKPLDFEFKGFYKSKSGYKHPVRFHRLVPINGDLDDYLSGLVNEWEFGVLFLDDTIISEFKRAD